MGSPAIKHWREGWKATVRVATDKPIAARKVGASCHILNTIRRRKRAFDGGIYAEDTLARAGGFTYPEHTTNNHLYTKRRKDQIIVDRARFTRAPKSLPVQKSDISLKRNRGLSPITLLQGHNRKGLE